MAGASVCLEGGGLKIPSSTCFLALDVVKKPRFMVVRMRKKSWVLWAIRTRLSSNQKLLFPLPRDRAHCLDTNKETIMTPGATCSISFLIMVHPWMASQSNINVSMCRSKLFMSVHSK